MKQMDTDWLTDGLSPVTIGVMPKKPLLPDRLEPVWDRLVEVTEDLRRKQAEETTLKAEAKELAVVLMAAGVDVGYLVGLPFSSTTLTNVRREKGLIVPRVQAQGGGDVS